MEANLAPSQYIIDLGFYFHSVFPAYDNKSLEIAGESRR